MAQERVQKILAKAGIASRRKAEALITQGLVTINGKVAKLGDKALMGKDSIKVNGKLLHTVEDKVYYAFHKPKGVISMLVDTENRPNLADYLSKVRERVFPVGRLDFTSEGIILLTNDGDFAEKLQRRDDIPRVYRIKLRGHLTEEMVRRIARGARIDKRTVRPHSVRIARELESKSEIEVVMMGAGAVDIRAMIELQGFLVERITRTALGHITLKGLPAGHYRLLKESQIHALLEQPELGMKVLHKEIEDSKPAGQRNLHPKKDADISADEALSPYLSSPSPDATTDAATDSTSESAPDIAAQGSAHEPVPAKRAAVAPRTTPRPPRSAPSPRRDAGAFEKREPKTFEKRGEKPFAKRGAKPSFEKRDSRYSSPRGAFESSPRTGPGGPRTGPKRPRTGASFGAYSSAPESRDPRDSRSPRDSRAPRETRDSRPGYNKTRSGPRSGPRAPSSESRDSRDSRDSRSGGPKPRGGPRAGGPRSGSFGRKSR